MSDKSSENLVQGVRIEHCRAAFKDSGENPRNYYIACNPVTIVTLGFRTYGDARILHWNDRDIKSTELRVPFIPQTVGKTANVDLNGPNDLYRLVKTVDTEPDKVESCGVNDIPIGSLYSTQSANKPVLITEILSGRKLKVRVNSTAALSANRWVGTDDSGFLIEKGVGEFAIGRIISGYATDEVATVHCMPTFIGF